MCKEDRIRRIVNYVTNMEKDHYINESDKETYLDQIEKKVSKDLTRACKEKSGKKGNGKKTKK